MTSVLGREVPHRKMSILNNGRTVYEEDSWEESCFEVSREDSRERDTHTNSIITSMGATNYTLHLLTRQQWEMFFLPRENRRSYEQLRGPSTTRECEIVF